MTTGKRVATISLVIFGCGMFQLLFPVCGHNEATTAQSADAQPRDELPALLKARAEAAKKAYEGTSKAMSQTREVGKILLPISYPEDAYRWSVRWFHAQRDLSTGKEERIAAAAAHLQRMQTLKEKVHAQTQCLLPGFENDAAEYYRVEAAIWLAQEKSK